MRRKVLLFAAILWGQGLIAAEGPVVAVQEALQRQQLYFGPNTGVLDAPTKSALRLFQARNHLPATGEIDSATLDVLQSPAAPRGSPVPVQSRPVAEPPAPPTPDAGSAPGPATVAKDRAFLEKVQTGREPVPPPNQAALTSDQPLPAPAPAPERAPLPPPEPAPRPTLVDPPPREVVEASPSPADPAPKPRVMATHKAVPAPTVRTSEPPPRIAERTAPPGSRVVERDDDTDPFEPNGVKIIRIPGKAADGRIYVLGKRPTTYPSTPAPIVRKAEPVEPPRREGFFHRLFRDKDD